MAETTSRRSGLWVKQSKAEVYDTTKEYKKARQTIVNADPGTRENESSLV